MSQTILELKGLKSLKDAGKDAAEGVHAIGTELHDIVTGNTKNLKSVGKGAAYVAVGTVDNTMKVISGVIGTAGKAAQKQPLLVAGLLAALLFNPVVNFAKNLLGMKTETQQDALVQNVRNLEQRNVEEAQKLGLTPEELSQISGINYRNNWAETRGERGSGRGRGQ